MTRTAIEQPATYPVSHKDGTKDKRYRIASEYCGDEAKRHVARFCGEWLGQSISLGSAITLCVGHNAARNGALIIEAIEDAQ
jgi:hypothetical protein